MTLEEGLSVEVDRNINHRIINILMDNNALITNLVHIDKFPVNAPMVSHTSINNLFLIHNQFHPFRKQELVPKERSHIQYNPGILWKISPTVSALLQML